LCNAAIRQPPGSLMTTREKRAPCRPASGP
jgi:hypothetical protein